MKSSLKLAWLCAIIAVALLGCGAPNPPADGGTGGEAGSGGTAGSGGAGGVAGSGGTAGSAGSGGTAGTGGTAGSAGSGGTAGTGGTAGAGGTAGTGGTGGVINASIAITGLPATDDDGNYSLEWAVTGLASTAWSIQEDDQISFPNPTGYTSFDTNPPYTHTFSGKADGLYCYRVARSPAGPYSAPECVTVARPGLPSIPVITSATFESLSAVRLVWNDSDSETSYELEYSFDDVSYSPLATIPANETHWDITELPPCATTYFRLRAKSPAGYSGYYGSGPMNTNATAIIDIVSPSFSSPFVAPGRYVVGCWDSGAEQGGIGIYDNDGNHIVDNSHLYDFWSGSTGWVFPRVNVLDCDLCTTWHLEAGRAFQDNANLILYFRFNTWSTNDHANFIAIHMAVDASSGSVVNVWGGDMQPWGIAPGIALRYQAGDPPYVNSDYVLPAGSSEGWLMGNAWAYISEVAGDLATHYDAGITIVDMNVPIRND